MKLETVNGKFIQISSAYIEVSPNDRIESGYFIDIKLSGKLPRCRKDSILHYSLTANRDELFFTTLFGYTDHHKVSCNVLHPFLLTLPVLGYRWGKKVEITDEVKELVRKRIDALCGISI